MCTKLKKIQFLCIYITVEKYIKQFTSNIAKWNGTEFCLHSIMGLVVIVTQTNRVIDTIKKQVARTYLGVLVLTCTYFVLYTQKFASFHSAAM